MKKYNNTLVLPSNPQTPTISNEESEYEIDTPNLNKTVSFIDVSGNITNRYSEYIEEENTVDDESFDSDNDDSSLINRKTTSSSLGSKFSRKSTNSSFGSKFSRKSTNTSLGSKIKRKSTSSSANSSKLGRKSTGSTLGSRLNTIYRKSTSTIGSGLSSFRFRNSFININRNKTLKKLLDTKTVGFAGGVTLLINGILGPGLIPTPQIFSESGLIIPSLTFLFFAIFSTICAQFIIEAMQTIPGNKHFQGTVEFSTLINFYFGRKMHILGQFILYMALQSANVSSIIYSAQTMDNFIINFFKKSCGIKANIPFFSNSTINEVNDSKFSLYCVEEMAKENSPFGNQFMLITLGYAITFIFIFPVGFMKLQDNINMQIVSFIITIFIFVIWFALFYLHGFNMNNVPLLSYDCKEVVGVVMFNFAFVTTIPSWINIKKKEISVQKSLWTSTITSIIIYIIIGYTAALSFKTEGTLNILSQLSSLNVFGRITTYVFSIAILMVSIPTFSIIVRNNLVQNKICGYRTATFLSHILPWICVLPFQTGTFINYVINWSSLLFVSTANFIIPIIIYLKCLKFKSENGPKRYFTPRQREILKTVHWSSKTIQGFIDAYPVTKDQEQKDLKNSKKNKGKNEKYENIYNEKYNSSSENLNDSNTEVPEIHLSTANEDNSNDDNKIVITEENAKKFLPPPPPPAAGSSFNLDNPYRNANARFSVLPTHPLFISNYYKGIPSWVPFKPKTFAKICLSLILIIIVAVIGLNVYEEMEARNILILFNKDNNGTNAIDGIYNENNNNPSYVGNDENSNVYEIIKNTGENKDENKDDGNDDGDDDGDDDGQDDGQDDGDNENNDDEDNNGEDNNDEVEGNGNEDEGNGDEVEGDEYDDRNEKKDFEDNNDEKHGNNSNDKDDNKRESYDNNPNKKENENEDDN
jgi:amino acid permease